MAQFEYQIHRIKLLPNSNLDEQIEKVLADYGMRGWELVQILHQDKVPEDPTYRLILKAEKPPVAWTD